MLIFSLFADAPWHEYAAHATRAADATFADAIITPDDAAMPATFATTALAIIVFFHLPCLIPYRCGYAWRTFLPRRSSFRYADFSIRPPPLMPATLRHGRLCSEPRAATRHATPPSPRVVSPPCFDYAAPDYYTSAGYAAFAIDYAMPMMPLICRLRHDALSLRIRATLRAALLPMPFHDAYASAPYAIRHTAAMMLIFRFVDADFRQRCRCCQVAADAAYATMPYAATPSRHVRAMRAAFDLAHIYARLLRCWRRR